MVSTPFFPFLASIFLTIFSKQLIVMRIFNTVIFAVILAVSYNLFRLLKINNVDYIVYFNRSKMFNLLKNEYNLFENVIYENEAGGILKYNN